jgi:serine/threonine protein kinase
MNLPTSITNQNELREYLKTMKSGMVSSGLNFRIIDGYRNSVDLTDTTILCRERHSSKKKITKESDYRYEVIASKYLGEGAFGTVFPIVTTLELNGSNKIKILKKESNKQRVVKVIPDSLSAKSNIENEFLISDIAAYLHIKPPVEVKFPERSKYYLVMRKISGQTLLDLLNDGSISRLETNRKFFLLLNLLEAVKTLHLKNLVHGDINCGNIMVDLASEHRKPSIKIIDFGCSSRLAPLQMERLQMV